MTTAAATVSGQGISFRIDTAAVQRVFDGAPRVAYFWLRDYLFRQFVGHRLAWLKTKRGGFGRGSGLRGAPTRVAKVNEGNVPPLPNEVTYAVEPRARRLSSNGEAARALAQLRADAYTGNEVMPVHQFGATIRSPELMAIPVRTRPGSPRAWRAKNPGKTLIAKSSRTGDASLLFEVVRKKARGRPRKDGRVRKAVEKLRLRFILTRLVKMDPTLRFYETWDETAGARDQAFSLVASRMLKDLGDAVDS